MAEAVIAITIADSARDAKRMRTLVWVMSLAFVGLLFDGYDLIVYGACVSTFLRTRRSLAS
jgi:AAHS family benzoate transporter-like MFS transporter